MQFLRRFKAAWNYAKFFQYNQQAENWSEDDTVNAYQFFRQTTGARLLLRLRNIALTNSLQAALEANETKASQAAGVAMTIANIEAHYSDLLRQAQAQAEVEDSPNPLEHGNNRTQIFSGA